MSSNNYKNIKIGWNKGKIEYKSSKNNSFWQSSLWAEILGKTHQARDIILCAGNSHEILLERRTIFGKYTGLYALGVDGNSINEELLEYIKTEIRQNNDLFLQIEPYTSFAKEVPIRRSGEAEDFDLENPQSSQGSDSSFKKELLAPFRRFIEPVTAILDLWIDEEKLLASFAEKGRYNIRLAQKRGISTRFVSHNTRYWDKTYLDAFYELLEETTARDKFSHNSLTYYQHFLETLEAHNAGGLLIAERDGVLHAAGIFVYWGDEAIYYYGASSSDREIRRDMATYLLQWEAIREGMKRHCKAYDFLWISEDGKGKLAGVTEFKLRFNPEKIHLPSEVVVVYKPILLKALQIVSRVKKLFR